MFVLKAPEGDVLPYQGDFLLHEFVFFFSSALGRDSMLKIRYSTMYFTCDTG